MNERFKAEAGGRGSFSSGLRDDTAPTGVSG